MAVPAFPQASETTTESGNRGRLRARVYQRVAVRCGCWLEHDAATVYGTTLDLGPGGLFLRTALPMQPGADVAVTLRLPGQRGQVVASGQVVRRVAPSEGDRPGLGVRFVELMDEKSLGAFLGTSLRASLDHDSEVG